ADAVAATLEKMGVSKNKITTVGFGEEQPIASNATKEGRAENRRVEAKFRNK
ncbi:OmpA family protein, partial [Campylobacter fetus]